MFKQIKKLFTKELEQSPPSSDNTSSILPTVNEQLTTKTQQIKEESYFSRKNVLINEFVGEPPPISNSNFSSWEGQQWKFKVAHKGFMALAQTEDELISKISRIDKGDTQGMYTEEMFNYLFDRKVVDEGDVLLADDVDFLKNHPNYAKPNIPESNTVVLQGIPQSIPPVANTTGTTDQEGVL